MTNSERRLLIKQAAKLMTLGVIVERRRNVLKKMLDRGVQYTDPRFIAAHDRFNKVSAEWMQLEAKHRTLKKQLL